MNLIPDSALKEIVLEKIPFQVRQNLSPAITSSMKVESIREQWGVGGAESLAYLLTAVVYGTKLEERTKHFYFKFPKNSLEELKERMPKWFRKIWPVKYTKRKRTIVVDGFLMYPELPYLPQLGKPTFKLHFKK